MKKIEKFIVMFLVVTALSGVALTAIGCDGKKPADVPTPVKLILDYGDVKIDYEYDEPFTYSGLKVQVEMSDGTKQTIATGYKVTPPDMSPGQHMVTVTYGALSAKYPIYVEDVTKIYDDADAFAINGAGVYVAEADKIDLTKCIAEPLDADTPFVRRTNTVFASNRAYLQNFGAEGNCLGVSFTADKEYDGVSLTVTLGNMTDADLILSDAVKMYFGFEGSENSGELDLTDKIVKADSWSTLAFDGLTVRGYGNFIIEFANDCNIVWDNIKVIVGASNVNSDSAVELSASSAVPTVLEIEDMNTEKLVVVKEVASANDLKFGQPMLKSFADNGLDKYLSDLATGAEISTVIKVDENSTVNFKLNAEIPDSYDLNANWEFTLDTFTFDSITAAPTGWSNIDLGSYPVKAGSHLFKAKIVGEPCNVDKFTFESSVFEGDVGVLIEDVCDADLTVYSFGTYKVEAEDMLDRSGWIPQFGAVDEMIEQWRHKDGKSGYSIGKVGRKKITDPNDPEKISYINSELKFKLVLKTKTKMVLKMSVADNNAVEGGLIPAGRISTSVDGKKLTYSSKHKFGYTEDQTYWNFGEIVYSAIVLEAGEYVISTKTEGIGYDWYVLEFYDPTVDADVEDFGKVRVEAENLLDRSGWIPNGNRADGTPNTVDDMIIGSYVSKIATNSQFKIVFDLGKRAAVKVHAKLSAWKHDNNTFQTYWMKEAKIDTKSIAFKGKAGSKFKDPSSTGSVEGWGIAESGFVTLEAGKHEIVWKSGDVSYDWFEICAYDPDGLLPELSFDEFGTVNVTATTLTTMKGIDPQWVGGDVGNAINNVNNKQFKIVFELTQRSAVKIGVRLGKYGYTESQYNPAWLSNAKIDDKSLTFTQQEGVNFKASGWAWGVVENNTVTLDAGIYEFSWTSGDVAYHRFTFDISAPAA